VRYDVPVTFHQNPILALFVRTTLLSFATENGVLH